MDLRLDYENLMKIMCKSNRFVRERDDGYNIEGLGVSILERRERKTLERETFLFV